MPVKWAGLLLLVVQAVAAGAARPKLLVWIVAEQFRPDYLERYRGWFSAGGFNRLLNGGAVFRQCRYEYLSTFPASGAAVLAAGAYPERNGIVAEYWYDREARRVVRAVEDPRHEIVGAGPPRRPGASSHRLAAPTLPDQLRLATGGRSRTVSISLRDQTAVLFAGRRPSGCYWPDETARWVTSTACAAEMPSWAAEFNRSRSALRFRGQPWRAHGVKDSAPPLRLLDGEGARGLEDFFAVYRASPFALEEQFDFARAALDGETLGRGDSTDQLVLSLSSLYLLGLETGADSPLLRDLVVRLDRKLEEFLAALDSRLGANNFWVVFTATQGLSELAEAVEPNGIPAGRVRGEELAAAVNARLSAALGRDSYVEKYVYPFLYLRRGVLEKLGARAAEAVELAGEAARGLPGVAAYYPPSRGAGLSPETAAPFARSIYPGRSGDLLIAYQPYFSERHGEGRGVATGSWYSYDTHVPLVFYGPPFRAQVFERLVSPADVAPTLAAALEIAAPASTTGRPLAEALKDR